MLRIHTSAIPDADVKNQFPFRYPAVMQQKRDAVRDVNFSIESEFSITMSGLVIDTTDPIPTFPNPDLWRS